jgi:lipopolysaccharide core heptose(I) kinase
MSEEFTREDLAEECAGTDMLQWAKRVAADARPEDVYRNKEGRKTLRFTRDGHSYFLKLHLGIGWSEIIKNLLQLRLPVLGAENEYRAVNALQALGVDTMAVAGYARKGLNPASIESLIITDDLVGTVSLEDYCADWVRNPPPWWEKQRLIIKLADSARKMHEAGINHRDFYICHFHLVPESLQEPRIRCHLIDLHRAQIRARVPLRWRLKDLAGLYFSAMDCGLTHRDLLRFVRHYGAGDLRTELVANAGVWRQVEMLATKLYRKDHGSEPKELFSEVDS